MCRTRRIYLGAVDLLGGLEESGTAIHIPAILLRHGFGTRLGPEDTVIIALLLHLILEIVIVLARLDFL
jgi:hypothetical protein